MGKYDFGLSIDENTSTGIIIRQIEEGSTVLEFGCAYGRLTRYLKENLSCKVYIIEIDQAAFDVAKQYAVDGVCQDVEQGDWNVRFSDVGFDYVIFADVLEHLRNPERILKLTKSLLKQNGKIIISYPNIGHSDVLVNLYDNRFTYTPTGLLDETHVHFLAPENVKAFCEKAGYKISIYNRTIVEPFSSEQAEYIGNDEMDFQRGRLIGRNDVDTYQFILTLVKREWFNDQQLDTKYVNRTSPYLVNGTVIEKSRTAEFSYVVKPNKVNNYLYQYMIQPHEQCTTVRFIPAQNERYVVSDIHITSMGNNIPFHCENMCALGDYYISKTMESQIVFDASFLVNEKVIIQVNLYIFADNFMKNMADSVLHVTPELLAEIDNHSDLKKALNNDKNEKTLISEIEDCHRIIDGLNWELTDAQKDANVSSKLYMSLCDNASSWMSDIHEKEIANLRFIDNSFESLMKRPLIESKSRVRDSNAQIIPDVDMFALSHIYPAPSAKAKSIAVHIHLYDEENVAKLIEYLANIPYDYDLYISCGKDLDKASICRKFACLKMAQTITVRYNQNIGQDIAPLYTTFSSEIKKHDYLLHIYTTGSNGGKKYDISALVGSETQVRRIFGLFQSNRNVGMIFSKSIRDFYENSWLCNKDKAVTLARSLNVEIDDGFFNYPVNHSYWTSIESIKPIFDLNLTDDDFDDDSESQNHGTLSGTLIRLIAVLARSRRYNLAIIDEENDEISFNIRRRDYQPFLTRTLSSAKEELIKYDAVSMAVFDTLITRKVYVPDDIFKIMNKKVTVILDKRVDFARLRVKAGMLAAEEYRENADIDRIYEKFQMLCKASDSQTEQIKKLEMDFEIDNSAPRKDMLYLFNFIKNKHIPVYLVCDTYLPSYIVKEMLLKNGFSEYEKLYVSCEIGHRKDNGSMWDYLAKVWDGKKVIHLGDDLNSDVMAAASRNIDYYYIPNPRDLFKLTDISQEILSRYKFSESSSYILGNVVNIELFNSPFAINSAYCLNRCSNESIAQSIFSPLLLAFIQGISTNVYDDQTILFSSENGAFLKKMYEVYVRMSGRKLNSYTDICTSEKVTNYARIFDERDIKDILSSDFTGSLFDLLLSRLNIKLPEFYRQLVVRMPMQTELVLGIISQYIPQIMQESAKQREEYLSYIDLSQVNLKMCTVASLGYDGRFQYNLCKITGIKIPGYYLFMNETRIPERLGCDVVSLINNQKDINANRFMACLPYLNALVQMSNGQSCNSVSDENNVSSLAHSDNLGNVEEITRMQNGVLRFVEGFCQFENKIGVSEDIDSDFAIHLYLAVIDSDLLPNTFIKDLVSEDQTRNLS